jgi:uroporphyrinogen III methyltransferase/synthase
VSRGFVYLVGAGPGHPGLLTVRGQQVLRDCEAIVYDRLAATVLPPDLDPRVRLHYVGKRASHHPLPQEEINRLLVRLAQEGLQVCRLKGGDPFVFGRGGEEALALRQAGVGYEIVPGVTAGLAAAAYAGIPVTHRGASVRVTLVTAHEDPRKEGTQVDWRWLGGDPHGTIAAYMPVSNLSLVVAELMAGGLPPDMPAAMIERGTLCCQRTLTAPLAQLPDRVARARLRPPALFLCGPTVALHESLSWFEEHPLHGARVVVTRPADQSVRLITALERLGMQPLVFPVIQTLPAAAAELTPLLDRLDGYDWVFMTSENGARYFLSMLHEHGIDVRALGRAGLACVGRGTADRLAAFGLHADFVPESFSAQALLREFLAIHQAEGRHILRVRGDNAPTTLEAGLRAAGAEVDTVTAYRVLPARPRPDVIEALAIDGADAVTFTSGSAVRSFQELFPEPGLRAEAAAVCIGALTADSARQAGWQTVVTARESTIDGLVTTLVDHLTRS